MNMKGFKDKFVRDKQYQYSGSQQTVNNIFTQQPSESPLQQQRHKSKTSHLDSNPSVSFSEVNRKLHGKQNEHPNVRYQNSQNVHSMTNRPTLTEKTFGAAKLMMMSKGKPNINQQLHSQSGFIEISEVQNLDQSGFQENEENDNCIQNDSVYPQRSGRNLGNVKEKKTATYMSRSNNFEEGLRGYREKSTQGLQSKQCFAKKTPYLNHNHASYKPQQLMKNPQANMRMKTEQLSFEEDNILSHEPAMLQSCEFIKSEYGGEDFVYSKEPTNQQVSSHSSKSIDENEQLCYAKSHKNQNRQLNARFYESLDQRAFEESGRPTFGVTSLEQQKVKENKVKGNGNLFKGNDKKSSKGNFVETKKVPFGDGELGAMICSVEEQGPENTALTSSNNFDMLNHRENLMRSCDYNREMNLVRCINHWNKKAKYRLVAELTQDQEEYFYCSKCAVNVAKQGCFNIEELTPQYIQMTLNKREEKSRLQNIRNYDNHAVQCSSDERESLLNNFQTKALSIVHQLEQKLTYFGEKAENLEAETRAQTHKSGPIEVYDQLIKILTQMKQEEVRKREQALKMKKLEVEHTVAEIEKMIESIKDTSYQMRKDRSGLLRCYEQDFNSRVQQIQEKVKFFEKCMVDLDNVQLSEQMEELNCSNSRDGNLQQKGFWAEFDEERLVEKIFDQMFEKLMLPKLQSINAKIDFNSKAWGNKNSLKGGAKTTNDEMVSMERESTIPENSERGSSMFYCSQLEEEQKKPPFRILFAEEQNSTEAQDLDQRAFTQAENFGEVEQSHEFSKRFPKFGNE